LIRKYVPQKSRDEHPETQCRRGSIIGLRNKIILIRANKLIYKSIIISTVTADLT
jgi:hypothetical protein